MSDYVDSNTQESSLELVTDAREETVQRTVEFAIIVMHLVVQPFVAQANKPIVRDIPLELRRQFVGKIRLAGAR